MAALEVLALNTVIPQIQAPQVGDSYLFPRVAEFSAGTALLPSLAGPSDPDTGMWFPAANTVAWSTGGLERMRLTAAGDLGLGTTPGGGMKLDILGGNVNLTNATYAAYQVVSGAVTGQLAANASGSVEVRAVSNHPLLLYTNNAERMRIKSAGQVRFVPLAADPTVNVEDGDVYYNSGTNKLRLRAAGAWVDLN